MREAGDFVEWAEVHGNFYGTSYEQIKRHVNENGDLLLEIDVQGARQVKARFPQACFIYVLPPDRRTLEKRLRKRGTEAGAHAKQRLENACRELLEAPWYDYLIVNDVLDEAVEALAAIVLAARNQRQAVLPYIYSISERGANIRFCDGPEDIVASLEGGALIYER